MVVEKPTAKEPPAAKPEAKDDRVRWVYDAGWFAKGNGDLWFEHNGEAQRITGRPWEFKEVKRTKEYIQVHDPRRGVSVRLAEPEAQARWDNAGEKAEWKPLYKGKWVSLD